MEEIIKKAIKGGWEKDGWFSQGEYFGVEQIAVLDPLFWQALGKACGWPKKIEEICDACIAWKNGLECNCKRTLSYVYHALHFHELNLTEGWDKAVAYLQEVTK